MWEFIEPCWRADYLLNRMLLVGVRIDKMASVYYGNIATYRSLMESASSKAQKSIYQYAASYLEADGMSTDKLNLEIDIYEMSRSLVNRFLTKVGIIKVPARIRAYEQELEERLS